MGLSIRFVVWAVRTNHRLKSVKKSIFLSGGKSFYMQWFKHDSNSTMDFKIKKLIIRYGAVGYAIYFHCLELIASEISDSNITFQLEHDAEIIADDLRIQGSADRSGREVVEEIMRYMIDLKLFEESNGRIFCFKMLKRLDTSMKRSQV